MSEALPNSGIAAVTWSTSPQVRVYFQDLQYKIRQSQFDGKKWTGGTGNFVINDVAGAKPAKPMTPIAAFEHREDVHVYYIATDNTIQEIVSSGTGNDWAVPSLNINEGNFKAHDLSRLAALPYTPGEVGIDCSVFYQKPDGSIAHLRRIDEKQDGKFVSWKEMPSFGGNVIPDFSLPLNVSLSTAGRQSMAQGWRRSIPTLDETPSNRARVYYQQAHNILADFAVDNGGAVTAGVLDQAGDDPTATNTNLAAIENYLFYLGTTDIFTSGSWYSSDRQWHIGADHPDKIKARPESGIAVVLDGNNLHRAYVQLDDCEIRELCFTKPWSDGAHNTVPTGPLSK